MNASELVQHVQQGGDEPTAVAAIEANAALARARDAQQVSIVCLAAYRRYDHLVAALRRQRDDLDLFEASCIGDTSRVAALLDATPGLLDSRSPDGFGALGYSAFFGHLELLRELLRRAAAVNDPASNAMRVCPLHSAAAHGDATCSLALCRALLEAGADPNQKQQAGYTPLHAAAQHGRLELVALLLSFGADRELANDQGERAIDLARSRGHASLVELLERDRAGG